MPTNQTSPKSTAPKNTAPKNIDEYVASFPVDIQVILEEIRLTIRKAAPDAQETISYKMPTFTLNGISLVHFAVFKKHIGLFPPVRGAMQSWRMLPQFMPAKRAICDFRSTNQSLTA